MLLAALLCASRVQAPDGGVANITEGCHARRTARPVEGQRVAVAQQGAGVGTAFRIAHPDHCAAEVDVVGHDAAERSFSVVHALGKGLPVVGGAQDDISFLIGDGVEAKGELRHMLVVVPCLAACHLGFVHSGQHQLCGHFTEVVAGVVSPLPYAGVEAADTVSHFLTGVAVEQRVVGHGVVGLALLVVCLTRNGGPVGVDACCGAGGVTLNLEFVGIRQVFHFSVLHLPRQHRLARFVDAHLQVLWIVEHLGALFLRRDFVGKGVALSIHHAGIDIDILPRAVGREECLAYNRFLQTLGVGLPRQLVGVVYLGRPDGACGDAIGKHQFVDVLALHGYHGVVHYDRHRWSRRTIPRGEFPEAGLVLVVGRHIPFAEIVVDLSPHLKLQPVATQLVGHRPDDGGLEVAPATVAAIHIVTDNTADVGQRLVAAHGLAH